MPTIPKKTILTRTNTSVNVLNVIRNNASVDYRNYIPIATPDAEETPADDAPAEEPPAEAAPADEEKAIGRMSLSELLDEIRGM